MKLETGNLSESRRPLAPKSCGSERDPLWNEGRAGILDNRKIGIETRNSRFRTRDTLIVLLVLLFVSPLLLPKVTFATDKTTLDEIIKGFDEKESSADALKEVLQGFEDETKDTEKGGTDDEILEGFDDKPENSSATLPEKRQNYGA